MRIAVCWLLLLFALPARAQTPPVFELPEVVIPGRRPQPAAATPASISVLTREDLEALGIATLAEALQLVPEAFIRTYGGAGALAEPSVRGFGPGQVLVLLNGVPLNNVALGQVDLSTVSLNGVERIEVLRGPFAALAGSGALGGVVNLVTARAGSGATARYGGAGERRLSVALDQGPLTLGVDVGGGDGFRPNSDFADLALRAELRVRDDLRVSVHHSRSDTGTPGDVMAPTPLDRQSSTRTVIQGQWTRGDSGRGRAYYSAETLSFLTPFGTSTYRAALVGGELQAQWQLRPQRVLVGGVEVQAERLDAEVFGSPIREGAVLGAAYLQYDAALSPRSLVSLGLRLDAHSRYGTALNPRAGIVVSLDEATRIRAAVGRTFRGPTFLHLFFPGCSTPGLGPESAWAAEIGVERALAGGMIAATVFAAEAVNLISSGCPPLNVDAASFRGVSIEGRTRVGARSLVRLTLTAQQAIDRTTGATLPRVPSLVANAALIHGLSATSSLAVLVQYVGIRRDFDFSVIPATMVDVPAYLDLGVRYQRHAADGWTMTIGIDNALDASYEVVKGFPAPGRRLFISTSRRF